MQASRRPVRLWRPLPQGVEPGATKLRRGVGEVESWEPQPKLEILQAMLDNIAKLRAEGLDVIED